MVMSNITAKSKSPKAANEQPDALGDAKERVSSALDQTKDYVRANPVPVITGALVLGFILGLLVPRESDERCVVNNKVDELKDLLSSFGEKISSSAGDSYGEVSSVLNDVLKKARKRFNLS